LLLIIVRSFLALKIKAKRVGKRIRFFDISFENTLAVSQACRQLDAPEKPPIGYVGSIGLPIPSHVSRPR
jgi:hypothetical protein